MVPPLQKHQDFICVVYTSEALQTTLHTQWADAVREAEKSYLTLPRRWCHGRRDEGHWVLVEVIGRTGALEAVSGKVTDGILKPGPLAIIFIPQHIPCCANHTLRNVLDKKK